MRWNVPQDPLVVGPFVRVLVEMLGMRGRTVGLDGFGAKERSTVVRAVGRWIEGYGTFGRFNPGWLLG